MKAYNIAAIGGDGIGPEVVAEALRILRSTGGIFGFAPHIEMCPYGAEHYLATGGLVGESELRSLAQFDAILFGAVGDPRLPAGLIEAGVLGSLRQGLDLFVNLRPAKLLHDDLSPLKADRSRGLDIFLVRENTEDGYAGGAGFVHRGTSSEVSVQSSIYTYGGIERVVNYAFRLALKKQRSKVTLVDKANALRSQDLWRRVFKEVSQDFAGISADAVYVDTACLNLIETPGDFDVIVTTNMFGDILGDLLAALQGGIGLAASGNIREGGIGLFEPVHGSAPSFAGRQQSCPLAAILSVALLLEHIGEAVAAAAVEAAVACVVKSPYFKGAAMGAHRTSEIGTWVADVLEGRTSATVDRPSIHD
jgi:3-isopropylmalate dehydrogenase